MVSQSLQKTISNNLLLDDLPWSFKKKEDGSIMEETLSGSRPTSEFWSLIDLCHNFKVKNSHVPVRALYTWVDFLLSCGGGQCVHHLFSFQSGLCVLLNQYLLIVLQSCLPVFTNSMMLNILLLFSLNPSVWGPSFAKLAIRHLHPLASCKLRQGYSLSNKHYYAANNKN